MACCRASDRHRLRPGPARPGRLDTIAAGLDLGPFAIRTQADRAWVRKAIAGPIQRAADYALDKLAIDLIDELVAGSPDLVARLLAAAGEAGGLDDARPAPAGRRGPADQLARV